MGRFARYVSPRWNGMVCVSEKVLQIQPIIDNRSMQEILQAISDAAVRHRSPACTLRPVPLGGFTVYAAPVDVASEVRRLQQALWPDVYSDGVEGPRAIEMPAGETVIPDIPAALLAACKEPPTSSRPCQSYVCLNQVRILSLYLSLPSIPHIFTLTSVGVVQLVEI